MTRVRLHTTARARVVAFLKGGIILASGVFIIIGIVSGLIDSFGSGDPRDPLSPILGAVLGFFVALLVISFGLRELRPLVARAHIDVHDNGIEIVHPGVLRKPLFVPRGAVRAAWVESTTSKRGRSTRRRFHLAGASGPDVPAPFPEWLVSREGGSPYPLISNVFDDPNVALVLTEPIELLKVVKRGTRPFAMRNPAPAPAVGKHARGLLLRVKDAGLARRALSGWGVLRPFALADIISLQPSDADDRRFAARRRGSNIALLATIGVQALLPLLALAAPTTACDQAEGLLDEAGIDDDSLFFTNGASEERRGPVALVDELPELVVDELPEAQVSGGQILDAEGAARDRVDPPMWIEELERRDFVTGYRRDWALSNRPAWIEGLMFAAPSDARSFHAFANRFGCRYANEAFGLPQANESPVEGAVGLQTRMSAGGGVEQISFVYGNTRFLVGIGHDVRPLQHDEVIQAARLQIAHLADLDQSPSARKKP
jgi:hypothetical protein